MDFDTILQPIVNLKQKHKGKNDLAAFAEAVTHGLEQTPKKLPSRFFYDGVGSNLFQKIMELPEYYVTRCEHEVLTTYRKEIVNLFTSESMFHLIDFGAGDAMKTKILLHELGQQKVGFEYVPVDISGDAMHKLVNNLQLEIPSLNTQAVV